MKVQCIFQEPSKETSGLVRGSRAQLIFSCLFPVAGSDTGRKRRTESINRWFHDWCTAIILDFLIMGRSIRYPAGISWDSSFSKGEEGLSLQASGAD